jgi:peptidoglycan glycosyltransferase
VVALNPSTGAILAMASYPSYDPNSAGRARHHRAQQDRQPAERQDPSPLLNNATQTTLPPGSTFKIVTSSAWYTQDAPRNPNTVVDVAAAADPAQREHAEQRQRRAVRHGSGTRRWPYAFAQSCNTPFAKIGIQLGGHAIKSMADKYGFNNAR